MVCCTNKGPRRLFWVPFPFIVVTGVSLPLFGLLICFLVSVYENFDEVTESICGVSNFVPSISAVTGIKPQIYLWRYAIGLHSAPRILLAFIYLRFHMSCRYMFSQSLLFRALVLTVFCLNLLDVSSFVGVAFVSNQENYPVHEHLFIVFLFASTAYMLATLTVHWLMGVTSYNSKFKHSFKIKSLFFGLDICLMLLLVHQFYNHRFGCKANAFSWFSASEYGIAIANMGFHLTAAYDFHDIALTTGTFKYANE
ncbi:hypothetical protein MN116_006478 [Schistosoma mekongi]|uniref:CWH43-like N-terminal domain-containing protein n=1 Tax=Schistosoma mekongi TaxID=38744 RepID=A0AAE1ZCM7_SCHME|nr:hypothetical protein MN116_006478 [Schistosoma mekongi]